MTTTTINANIRSNVADYFFNYLEKKGGDVSSFLEKAIISAIANDKEFCSQYGMDQSFDVDKIEKSLLAGKRVAADEAEFILSYGMASEPGEPFTVGDVRNMVMKSQVEIANGNVYTNDEMKTYFRTLIDSLPEK